MKAERRRKEAATTTFHTGLASECAKSKKCNYDMLQCARRIGWRKCFGPKQVARAFPPHAQPHIIVNGILGESSPARCQLKVFPSLMSVFVALRDVIGFAIRHSRWRLFVFWRNSSRSTNRKVVDHVDPPARPERFSRSRWA